MSLEHRLSDWVEAGLIDEAAAARILAHERRDRRPLLRWAIAGLGGLALSLGLLLLVAANWDRIGDWWKLSVHMLLLLASGAGFWRARADGRALVAEALLLLFAVLVLGGLALEAQVYQKSGPVWHLLLWWLALAGPAVWLGGSSRLAATLLLAMLVPGPMLMAIDTMGRSGFWLLAQGLAMAVPLLLMLLAQLAVEERPAFRRLFRQAGIFCILSGASLAHLVWAQSLSAADAFDNIVRLSPPLLALALLLWRARRHPGGLPPPLPGPLLVAPFLALLLALAIPHPDQLSSRILGVVVYAALWGWVARGAVVAGWNGLFAVAVAAIAVRLFIIYLELFGSLAATGGGLVAGGLLLLALGWGWQRLVSWREGRP